MRILHILAHLPAKATMQATMGLGGYDMDFIRILKTTRKRYIISLFVTTLRNIN